MQGELVVIAVGLVVALAFSTLIKAFTDSIVTPLINGLVANSTSPGLGWTINGQRIDVGAFIAALVYFGALMVVVYFVIVVPYRSYMANRGAEVFGPPAPTKECPYCMAGDLPVAATKCRHCTSELAEG
jgi:large conductance mechanosensitive channel